MKKAASILICILGSYACSGQSWSALGTGLNKIVFALGANNGGIYAAGDFTTAGGNLANRIAKWDGSNWSALGSGINCGYLKSLAVYNSELYVWGLQFYLRGNNPKHC
jgi:hypothetical protein